MVKIEASPLKALVDVPLRIKISGLKSSETVTIRSKLLSEENMPYYSIVNYVADTDGRVNLNTDASIGGYYTGVEPMGLIWSMKLAPEHERKFLRLEKRKVNSPFIVEFAVFSSLIGCVEDTYDVKPIVSIKVERWYMSENVTRTVLNDQGFDGVLFLPKGKGRYPGVIDLFGSKGGMTEFRASLLASHGYAALTINYFDFSENMSDGLQMELFEKAAIFLSSHSKVNTGGIGIIGVSMGGSISLFLAAHFPNLVKCVVNINGLVFANFTDFHYKGRTWMCVRHDGKHMDIQDNGWRVKHGLDLYTYSEMESSSFDMQDAKANFLFIVSEDDCCIVSHNHKSMIERVMNGRTNYRVLVYPGAGHLVEPPYSPFSRQTAISKRQVQVWGGNAKDHAMAQEKAWKETLNFLRENLSDNFNNNSVKSNL